MGESHSPSAAGHYNANYGNFETTLYAQIRHEAFGEDIGQNSWLTAEEQDSFLEWLDLRAGKKLLDIACGAGGPTLRVAANTGCSVVGLDMHQQAIKTARSPRPAWPRRSCRLSMGRRDRAFAICRWQLRCDLVYRWHQPLSLS